MSSKILIFDGQVFQTPALHRGMGKYSLELIAAVMRLNREHTQWDRVVVLLSSKLETKDAVKELTAKIPHIELQELELLPSEIGNPKFLCKIVK